MNTQKFFVGRAIGLLILLALVGLIAAFYSLNNYIYDEKQGYAGRDPKNAEYIIKGERVRLTNGISETENSQNPPSKITTRYFGNELALDLNKDGREDTVFLLSQEIPTGETLYYVVAAINSERGYVGSEAVFLGDRIAPQTTEKGAGNIIVVNYADRAPGENVSVKPSVGKSIWLLFDPQTMQFGEVVKNFEGEADPSRMSLGMKTWTWVSALYNDGREIKPTSAKAFTITFGNDGRFSATTDCNRIAGGYSADKGKISFSNMISTKMYCEGSQESEFASLLENSSSYHFTSRGELILDIKFDSGSVVFK